MVEYVQVLLFSTISRITAETTRMNNFVLFKHFVNQTLTECNCVLLVSQKYLYNVFLREKMCFETTDFTKDLDGLGEPDKGPGTHVPFIDHFSGKGWK